MRPAVTGFQPCLQADTSPFSLTPRQQVSSLTQGQSCADHVRSTPPGRPSPTQVRHVPPLPEDPPPVRDTVAPCDVSRADHQQCGHMTATPGTEKERRLESLNLSLIGRKDLECGALTKSMSWGKRTEQLL